MSRVDVMNIENFYHRFYTPLDLTHISILPVTVAGASPISDLRYEKCSRRNVEEHWCQTFQVCIIFRVCH